MSVRRLRGEDLELAVETIRKFKEPNDHSSFSDEYLKKVLSRPENILIVAEQNGIPTGLLLAYVLDRIDRDQKMVCIYEIGVSESFRRRGIGRALIEELKFLCKQENVMKAWVITNRANVGAVRLYESTGAAAGPARDEMIFIYQQ
jgi:aminoglycoside 3-N-acetyltransferase I